jgi:hypothetical protein
LNLRPPGPQPGALPDCATPRGRTDSTAPERRAKHVATIPSAAYVNICSYARRGQRQVVEALRSLSEAQADRAIRVAPKGPRTGRQLLRRVPCRLQKGALRGKRPALRSGCPCSQASPSGHACDISHRVLPRACLRRLRRDRPARARVRSQERQALQHFDRPEGPQLAERSRRDCQVRRGLCKLSSTPNRPQGSVRTRGGSSTVEPRPSKAMMRVQFPSAALAD